MSAWIGAAIGGIGVALIGVGVAIVGLVRENTASEGKQLRAVADRLLWLAQEIETETATREVT